MPGRTELEDTGERMVPEFHDGLLIYAEHLIRYRAISELVTGKVVLDIASGSGYGTALLAESARKVYGFDANKGAINYATERFGTANIEFQVASATQIPLSDNSVDVVVTFETIEHIDDYEAFISEILRVLKPDGIAVVSTPNDLEFAEGNHFHLHQFEKVELVDLLQRSFANISEYYQATWKYVAIGTMRSMAETGVLAGSTLNMAPIKEEECLYFYFVCSNAEITDIVNPVGAVGEHYSDRAMLQQHVNNARQLDQRDTEIARLQADVMALTDEIEDIRSGRAYRLARALGDAKARLRSQ